MNSNVPHSSKRTLIIIVAVGLLGILAGSAATYVIVKRNTQSINTQRAAQPQGNQNAGNQLALETSLPAGTVSPKTIADKPNDYLDKESKVRGRIVEIAPDKYIIVSQESSGGSSLMLDVSGMKVDMAQYVSGYTDPEKSPPSENGSPSPKDIGAVTVTGKVSFNKENLILTASKIEF